MARALVAEPSLPIASALALFLRRAGHEPVVARNAEEAVAALHGGAPVDLVLASTVGFPGEALCARVKAQSPATPVLLCFAAGEPSAFARAQAVAAEGYFLLPPRAHEVQPLVGLCAQLGALRARVAALEAGKGGEPTGHKGTDAEFFKKYMTHEVKRSRRYQMPVALVLAGLDALPGGRSSQEKMALKAEAVSALALLLRDIDIVVATPQDRFLVFLPNTGREGAVKVATRVQQRLGRLSSLPGLKASVGVAAWEPRGPKDRDVTFGKLLAQATALVRKVQARGGGKVGVGAPSVRAPASGR